VTLFGYQFPMSVNYIAPHWEGEWKVTEVKNNVNVKIWKQSKVVHVNRLRHHFQQTPVEAQHSHNEVTSGVENFITQEETAHLQ